MSEVDGIEKQEEIKEEGFVSKKAYETVSSDMHKYKAKMRELEALKNEYESQLKASEEQKMQEKAQWKELFEQRTQELESLKEQNQKEKSKYLDAVKKNALKTELGVKIRDEYLNHAKYSEINFNEDGTVNYDTVREVANKFREEHSQLIPSTQSSASTNVPAGQPSGPKVVTKEDLAKMSASEKIAYLKSL